MQMRSSNALLKFGADGLMQSLDGSNFYSATPLRFSAKLAFKGGANAPTAVAKFAPDGNSLTAEYESTGIFKFTWNKAQSDADYAVEVTRGAGKPSGWNFIPYDVTTTYFRLEFARNTGYTNPAADVVAYVLVYRWA